MNTKSPLTRIIQVALLALPLVCCGRVLQAAGEVGPNYVLFKNVRSVQTDVNAISLGNDPYRIDVLVQAASNGSVVGGTVSLPAGSSATSPQTLVLQNDGVINDGTYAFQENFADQPSLNSNYADGTYVLQINGASSANYNASLGITGGVYPTLTPSISNTNWAGGSLTVNPSASFTISWGNFTGSTASDRIGVAVGRIQDNTSTFQVLPSTATSYTFPANFFESGQSYRVHVVFVKVSATDTTDISGSTGFAGYGRETRVTIQTGTWMATGSLNTACGHHTATLLQNGKVLVAGGLGSSNNAIANAELYNPASGIWSATGSLSAARAGHTAILLANGKVLVAGGLGSGNSVIASASLYNPASGTWTATASLNTARYLHTATLLPNGKVLVAGGLGSGGAIASAEVYDPATGTWTVTGSLNAARRDHTATLLPNGKVLVAGGQDNSSDLASAELYDPGSGTWALTGSLNTARRRHTANLLPNGTVLVSGGSATGDITLASAELYDPAIGAWTVTGSLSDEREEHTANLLPNGKVLVAGGNLNVQSGVNPPLASAELYDPANATWIATGSLNTARDVQTATLLLSGEVLAAGGVDNNGHALASAELYVYDTTFPIIIGGNVSASATVGQQFVYQISATNNPTSYGASGLPSGLSIDTTSGLIYGIPTASGSFSILISASNPNGTGLANLALAVQPAPSGPQIISSTSATGRTGQPFDFLVLVSGATSSAHLSTSPLPPGLSVDAVSGSISGTPTSDGNFPITLTVIDGAATASATLQLTFTSDPEVPIITSPSNAFVRPGQFFSYTMTAADPNAIFSYIGTDGLKGGALPSGLHFDGVATISGTFNGAASRIGRTLSVANGGSDFSSDLLSLSRSPNVVRPNTLKKEPPLGIIQILVGDPETDNSSSSPLNLFQAKNITLSASPSDAGTTSGSYNDDLSFTARALFNQGFHFVDWTENGQEQSASPNYTFTPTADRTLVANFAVGPPPTPTQVGGGGTINTSSGQASFTIQVAMTAGKKKKKGKVTGSFSYSDPGASLTFSANKITSATISGNQASLSGTAKGSGKGAKKISFTVNVTDNDNGPNDTFSISAGAYSASGTLTSGDVLIH